MTGCSSGCSAVVAEEVGSFGGVGGGACCAGGGVGASCAGSQKACCRSRRVASAGWTATGLAGRRPSGGRHSSSGGCGVGGVLNCWSDLVGSEGMASGGAFGSVVGRGIGRGSCSLISGTPKSGFFMFSVKQTRPASLVCMVPLSSSLVLILCVALAGAVEFSPEGSFGSAIGGEFLRRVNNSSNFFQ